MSVVQSNATVVKDISNPNMLSRDYHFFGGPNSRGQLESAAAGLCVTLT